MHFWEHSPNTLSLVLPSKWKPRYLSKWPRFTMRLVKNQNLLLDPNGLQDSFMWLYSESPIYSQRNLRKVCGLSPNGRKEYGTIGKLEVWNSDSISPWYKFLTVPMLSALKIILLRMLTTNVKKEGERGSPYLSPIKALDSPLLMVTVKVAKDKQPILDIL